MEYSCVELNDLPDEILMMIFKKLHNIVLLYSLMGFNKRLNKILHDSIFTNRLSLLRFVESRLIKLQSATRYFVYPLSEPILDRLCSQILPEIHDKVKRLDLESSSMERILLSANYPNLSGLGLYNIQVKRAINLFSDETFFTSAYKHQILSLVIDINTNAEQHSTANMNALLFTHIFTTFINLRLLNLGPSSIHYQYVSFDNSPLTFSSSTLTTLRVCLTNFRDCLYLLDGRFCQLHTILVHIDYISPSRLIINNKEKLPNLRCFSLYGIMNTEYYDELIVPLLHRMVNLEVLDLSFSVWVKKTFIDGNNFTTNFINRMLLLKKFTFNIRSLSRYYNEINLPSNEDIRYTFKDFKDNQVISCIDYFHDSKYSQCHVYSQPYQLKNYDHITNNFLGGSFKCVREISLYDEYPFEHEFFLRIQKSFPLLEKLTLINEKRQKNKRLKKSQNENQDLLIIKYSRLIKLDISKAHKDYHEQFLFDTKTCLPNDIRVYMNYRSSKKVTRNFRRNATRSNCGKMSFVLFYRKLKFPEHLKDYFPHARII